MYNRHSLLFQFLDHPGILYAWNGWNMVEMELNVLGGWIIEMENTNEVKILV